MKTLVVNKGRTEYKLQRGAENWIIFTREVKDKEDKNLTHVKESLSINVMTNEVHCNRTGKETFGFKRCYDKRQVINKIFGIETLIFAWG